MTKQITIYSSYLFACLPHINEFHEEKSLRYLHIGDGFVAACNGITSIVLEDNDLKGCSYLIPVQVVRELESIFKETETDDPQVSINIKDNGTASLWTDGSFDLNFELGNLKVQDFKKLHGEKPGAYNGVPPIFDPSLLCLFQKSQEYLYGSVKLGVQVFSTGETGQAYVEIDQGIYGAIMPMDPKFTREIKTLGHQYRGRHLQKIQGVLDNAASS